MACKLRFEIDADPASVQRLVPTTKSERYEGIDFSCSGEIIGVATSDTNAVLLFRRKLDGLFEAEPYSIIRGLDYPHDLSFAMCGDIELLAVAQRTGAIAVFERDPAHDTYSPQPILAISGPESKLDFSDGVAFVPPDNNYLAACNLTSESISFYPQVSRSPIQFAVTPEFELKHASVKHPDGLAFSRCGKWLAIANHGNHTVSIFRRRNKFLSGGKLRYGPKPVTVIDDSQLFHPHSVAFTPQTCHLIVTNSGANYFSVYEPERHYFGTRWSPTPVFKQIVNSEAAFREVNARNQMEGGPKGVATHKNNLAICSPEFGVKIYSFREPATQTSHRSRDA